MANDVVLGSALRTNLLSLQRTQSGIDKIQNILATGLKVSSALDNPQNFFASQALSNRAGDLTRALDGIGQSISTINAADKGVTAIKKLVDQADSIVESAREAVVDGTVEAKITGNVDLRGVSNLASILGISNTDDINFTYIDKNDAVQTASVQIDTNDSIDQLISEINDIGGGGYIDASLTEEGYLEIRETTGKSFTIDFDADGATAALDAADLNLAQSLGFGDFIEGTRTGNGVTEANAEITVAAATKLESGVFYETATADGYAEASDLLTAAFDAHGGTARFAAGSAGDADTITFTVNGTSTSSGFNVGTTTIQGLVDGINNDTNIGDLVEASYDETTGKFSIESIDSSVTTITTQINDAVDGGAARADFDFGLDTALVSGGSSTDAEGETFLLASASAVLGQLEEDYNTVRTQIDELVEDAGYRGTNLLKGDTLETFFNEDRSNSLQTEGESLTSAGLGIAEASFASLTNINAAGTEVRAATDSLRSFGSKISNSLSIIQTREDFTKDLVSELKAGSDKLTVADQNEEGAKLLALQTRQQLGVTSLSLAVQSQQSVLRLF